MNRKYLYAYYKFRNAVDICMTTTGPDREKFKNIYIYHLIHLREEQLPRNCLSKFSYIKEKLTDPKHQKRLDPQNRMGTVYWAANHLGPRTIPKIKRYIWEIYQDVEQALRE